MTNRRASGSQGSLARSQGLFHKGAAKRGRFGSRFGSRRFGSWSWRVLSFLALLGAAPALAQFNGTSGIYALNHMTFGVMSSSPLVIISGGTGYTPGDVLTLDCGDTFVIGTKPTATVTTTSNGVITAITLTTTGLATKLPSTGLAGGANGVCNFTTTGGTGTGAVLYGVFGFNAAILNGTSGGGSDAPGGNLGDIQLNGGPSTFTGTPTLPATDSIFTPPATGAVPTTLQTRGQNVVYGTDFGMRVGGSTDDSRSCIVVSGSNTCIVSGESGGGIGDFQLYDDVRINRGGPVFAGGGARSVTLALANLVTGGAGSTSATLVTTKSAAAGTNVLTVGSGKVPQGLLAGNVLTDSTNAVIPGGTTVVSMTTSTITISNNITGGGVQLGDVISFTPVTCSVWVDEIDTAGGVGAASTVQTISAPAFRQTTSAVQVTYTPSVNNFPGAVYEDCGGGEVYMGTAQPRIVATMTAGSGYTEGGPYLWTAALPGCTAQPQGFITVDVNGHIENPPTTGVNLEGPSSQAYGRVEPVFPGYGCTGGGTVTVPAAAGPGTGGGISLALYAVYNDAGQGPLPGGTPDFVPPTHAGYYQWEVATIGGIAGNVLTLCVPGTGTATVPCSPQFAGNSGTFSIKHSWIRAINATVAAVSQGSYASAGEGIALMPCGTFEGEAGQITIAASNVLLGATGSQYCFRLELSGVGPQIRVGYQNLGPSGKQIIGSGINGVNFLGQNVVAGYSFDAALVNHAIAYNVFDTNSPCHVRVFGSNAVLMFNHTGNNGWAENCDDYDFESTATNLSKGDNTGTSEIVIRTEDIYYNNGPINSTNQGITSHNGIHFNDTATEYCLRQCAVSDESGYNWWFDDSTGYQNFGQVGGARGVIGFHCDDCDTEFAVLDEVRFTACTLCWWHGNMNGSRHGNEVYVDPLNSLVQPIGQITINSSRMSGGYLSGLYIGGGKVIVTSDQINTNSVAGPGLYPGVECAARCIIANDFIGLDTSATKQSYPVVLDATSYDSYVGNDVVTDNTFQYVLDQSGPGSGNVVNCNPGSGVNDCTGGQILPGAAYVGVGDLGLSGMVSYWGLRCYSKTYVGSVAILWDSASGSTSETILKCSPGGFIYADPAHATLVTTCAVACEVGTLYDQAGTGNNVTAAHGHRPTFAQTNCGYTKHGPYPYCMVLNGTTSYLTTAAGITGVPQGFDSEAFAIRTGATTVMRLLTTASGDALEFGGANTITNSNNGTLLALTGVTDNQWHSTFAESNGASSATGADGINTTGAVGTDAAGTQWWIGTNSTVNNYFLAGNLAEVFITSALNGPAASGNFWPLVHGNQAAYWGTPQ